MTQFAARDRAQTLAPAPHSEVENAPGAITALQKRERPPARLTAANFKLLKQRLSHGRKTDLAADAALPLPAPEGQDACAPRAPQLAEVDPTEHVCPEPRSRPAEPAPALPMEPQAISAGSDVEPADLHAFDLRGLRIESYPSVHIALSPLDRDPAAEGLLSAASDGTAPPAGAQPAAPTAPLEVAEPQCDGETASLSARSERPEALAGAHAFEFPATQDQLGERGPHDLASLIVSASPRDSAEVEEAPQSFIHLPRDLRLILEPGLPALDEFGTADFDEALAASRSASPAPDLPDAPPGAGPAAELRPAEYRFWESSAALLPAGAESAPNDAAEDSPPSETAEEPGAPDCAEEPAPAAAAAQPEPSVGDNAHSDLPVRVAEIRRRFARSPLEEPSEEAGEVARMLIEIMSLPNNATQPQERALAADTLLHLIPRLPLKTLMAMAERLSLMEAPPPLILAQLIHDRRIEIAGPLLERCPAIAEHDLIEVIMADRNEQSNRMIARRRTLSPALCDGLIATGDPSTILTLVRNPGAMLSHEAFHRLNEFARTHPSLQAPLATRADLPAPVAFELFWMLPAELRRYVISRFLTDSSTLGKILKLTSRIDGEAENSLGARFSTPEEIDRLIGAMTSGSMSQAETALADALGLNPQTASRMLADAHGESLCVGLKALGVTRARFEEFAAAAKAGGMLPVSNLSELQGFFESLSFNKARVLLTYWDWAVQRKGPYAGVPA